MVEVKPIKAILERLKVMQTNLPGGSLSKQGPPSANWIECPKCHGAYFASYDAREPALWCDCRAAQAYKGSLARDLMVAAFNPELSGLALSSAAARHGFADFTDPGYAEAVMFGKALIERGSIPADKPRYGLYMHGAQGVGKTALAAAIVRAMIRAYALPSLFVKVSNLMDLLLEAQMSEVSSTAILVGQLKNVPILVLDDLGAERATDFTARKLLEVVDFRYETCRRTVVTSNLSLSELGKRYKGDEQARRIVSRLLGLVVEAKIIGPDRRAT